MKRPATRAGRQAADATAAAPPGHHTVAVSGGSPTTGREPPGQRVGAKAPRPAAKFAKVSMAVRIPELARWIAARPSFTFAEASAADAPSPCSPSVMAYTLLDARLASALADLGYLTMAGGKNGYTVCPIESPPAAPGQGSRK